MEYNNCGWFDVMTFTTDDQIRVINVSCAAFPVALNLGILKVRLTDIVNVPVNDRIHTEV